MTRKKRAGQQCDEREHDGRVKRVSLESWTSTRSAWFQAFSSAQVALNPTIAGEGPTAPNDLDQCLAAPGRQDC